MKEKYFINKLPQIESKPNNLTNQKSKYQLGRYNNIKKKAI